MVKNYIFLGAPGVGKGTLAEQLAKNYGLIHVSTGEIFRQEIEQKTTLGLEIKSIVDRGEYVPDELTNQIVKKTLLSPTIQSHGFILDGYPRTINQAQFLKRNNIKINQVILLTAPLKMVLSRLLGRKRADDNPDIISQRIHVYNTKTKPLIEYYQTEKILKIVDASGDIEQNYQNLVRVL